MADNKTQLLDYFRKQDYTNPPFDQTKIEEAIFTLASLMQFNINKIHCGGFEESIEKCAYLNVFKSSRMQDFIEKMQKNKYINVRTHHYYNFFHPVRTLPINYETTKEWVSTRHSFNQIIHRPVLTRIYRELTNSHSIKPFYHILKNVSFGLCIIAHDEFINSFKKNQKRLKFAKICITLLKAFNAGAWLLYPYENEWVVITRPGFRFQTERSRQVPHNNSGPAVWWPDKTIWNEKYYFWRGFEIPEWTYETSLPKGKDLRERIIQEENAERRRCMIEKIGYDKFLKIVRARIIDKSDKGILYDLGRSLNHRLNERSTISENTVVVRVKDSSTDREFFLRVRPGCRTVNEAIASTFGLSAINYAPTKEA